MPFEAGPTRTPNHALGRLTDGVSPADLHPLFGFIAGRGDSGPLLVDGEEIGSAHGDVTTVSSRLRLRRTWITTAAPSLRADPRPRPQNQRPVEDEGVTTIVNKHWADLLVCGPTVPRPVGSARAHLFLLCNAVEESKGGPTLKVGTLCDFPLQKGRELFRIALQCPGEHYRSST